MSSPEMIPARPSPLGRLAAWVAAFLMVANSVGLASSPHDLIAPSLVYLKIDYTPTKGPKSGVAQTDQSTGFFVSDDGFILTSYHLLENLSETAGENVTLTAAIGDPQAQPVTAAIVNGVETLDLLLLKIRPTTQNPRFPGLKLGHAGALNSGDHIYTSGFNDKELVTDENTVSNRLGPLGIGYLWTVNISVAPGQSGSPVYQSDGKVIGILKGENKATAKGYMVPIEFADGLISFLKIKALEDQIVALSDHIGWNEHEKPLAPRLDRVEQAMQDVSKDFVWTGQEVDGTIVLDYHKLVSGAPQIKDILTSITPLVTKESGETQKDLILIKDQQPGKEPQPRIVKTTPGERGGRAIIPEFGTVMGFRLKGTGEKITISKVEVSIVPTLDDEKQTTLDPVSISVDTKRYSN